MNKRKKRLWQLTIIMAIVLVIVTFTPLVTPSARYTPCLFSLPYTLWTGIIISLGLTALTLVAAVLHQGSKKE